MDLGWLAAATRTKTSNVGLVFAAIFVVGFLFLVIRAAQANRRRARIAAEYAREEGGAGASAPPLPSHTWQAVDNPDLSSLFGFPNGDVAAQMPALGRLLVRQAERLDRIENVRSTTLADTTLLVFDQIQEHRDGNRIWTDRTLCGRFGLGVNCPWLEVNANAGIGTVAVGRGVQSFKFEYDDFNQAFSVIGADQKFAFTLVDDDMMRWLLAHPQLRSVHLLGTGALATFKPADAATDADAVFAFVSGFLSRIAPLVRHEWPSS